MKRLIIIINNGDDDDDDDDDGDNDEVQDDDDGDDANEDDGCVCAFWIVLFQSTCLFPYFALALCEYVFALSLSLFVARALFLAFSLYVPIIQ